jgi:hypothetical protein
MELLDKQHDSQLRPHSNININAFTCIKFVIHVKLRRSSVKTPYATYCNIKNGDEAVKSCHNSYCIVALFATCFGFLWKPIIRELKKCVNKLNTVR